VPREIARRAGWPGPAEVCEIGAGGGALTAALLKSGRSVTAIELDPALAELLRERFPEAIATGRLRVAHADFLEFPLEDLAVNCSIESATGPAQAPASSTRRSLWVAGNLPYGITTPILLRILEHRALFAGAVLMVQREYGDRMLARAGQEAYSSLSVWVAAHAESRALLRVGRSAFWPRPGVESVVVELLFPDPPPYTGDRRVLERVLRASFGQRRKTLENALAHGLRLSKESARRILERAGCDPAARAETLPLARFASLADVVSAQEAIGVDGAESARPPEECGE
jgi:16S rRNA (adenine1518-N6/adenine1519-N6)-dimethyltransferase